MGTQIELYSSTNIMQVKLLVNCKVLHKCDWEWEEVSVMGSVWVIKAVVQLTGCAVLSF